MPSSDAKFFQTPFTYSVYIHTAGLQVGFTMNSYTASEAEEQVEVCVRVVSGQLGTDITLQLETVSETAVGEWNVTASLESALWGDMFYSL